MRTTADAPVSHPVIRMVVVEPGMSTDVAIAPALVGEAQADSPTAAAVASWFCYAVFTGFIIQTASFALRTGAATGTFAGRNVATSSSLGRTCS